MLNGVVNGVADPCRVMVFGLKLSVFL